jgi:hypothetical protein
VAPSALRASGCVRAAASRGLVHHVPRRSARLLQARRKARDDGLMRGRAVGLSTGASIFGTGSCKPPAVCAALLPCARVSTARCPTLRAGARTCPARVLPWRRAARASPHPCADATEKSTGAHASRAWREPTSRPPRAVPRRRHVPLRPALLPRHRRGLSEDERPRHGHGPDSYACVPQSSACIAGCVTDPPNRCSLCDAWPRAEEVRLHVRKGWQRRAHARLHGALRRTLGP